MLLECTAVCCRLAQQPLRLYCLQSEHHARHATRAQPVPDALAAPRRRRQRILARQRT
jgi:hypothetical protein